MTPEQALSVLDQATDPKNVGKLQRIDYVNIENALNVLRALVKKPIQGPAFEAASA